jgi:hypothetical protein
MSQAPERWRHISAPAKPVEPAGRSLWFEPAQLFSDAANEELDVPTRAAGEEFELFPILK